LLSSCATTSAATPTPAEEARPIASARATVEAFLAAAEARDFERVFPLLARAWRERYGHAARLAQDFEAEPLATERVTRIKAALAKLAERDEAAVLEWAPGHTLRLVREPEGWRITQLD
jgi:hypothetical protein